MADENAQDSTYPVPAPARGGKPSYHVPARRPANGRKMVLIARRCGPATLLWSALAAVAVDASPAHLRSVERVPLAAPRTVHVPLSRGVNAPLPLVVRNAPLMHTAPLVPLAVVPEVLRLRPAFSPPGWFPRLASAALFAAFAGDDCTRARPPLTQLPGTAFAPLRCSRTSFDGTQSAPSLTAAHNKRALYGPAFSPGSDGP